MSLTPNDEPRGPRRSSAGWGWLVPLLLIAPTLIREVQRRTAGTLTNDQLFIIVAGIGALIVLVLVGQRAWSNNAAPPQPPTYDATYRSSYIPQAPRFEPILTGKVVLAGVGLGLLFALGTLVLLTIL